MKKVHKAYYYRVNFLNALHDEANNEAAKMLNVCCENLGRAITAHEISKFAFLEKRTGTQYMIRELQAENGIFSGIIGRYRNEMAGLIAECDMSTMLTHELKPSEPDWKFENYTYFSLSPLSKIMVIVDNSNLPDKIYQYIVIILTNLLGSEPFLFTAEPMIDTDIDNRLSSLTGNVTIEGTIQDREAVFHGRPRFKKVNDSIGGHVVSRINFTIKEVRRDKVVENYNELHDISSDPSYSRFNIKEDCDDEKGIINLIENCFHKQSKLPLNDIEIKNKQDVYALLRPMVR